MTRRPKKKTPKPPKADATRSEATSDSNASHAPTGRRRVYVLVAALALSVIGVLAAVALTRPSTPAPTARTDGPSASVETTSIELGRVPQDQKTDRTITISNVGSADLVIRGVSST